ncbi:MAG TPA: glycoside hydrolase family 18 protein [Pirellulales bacterium]|nr:glycoside hydrolase family 18 protein [Pirellulales bacterium]
MAPFIALAAMISWCSSAALGKEPPAFHIVGYLPDYRVADFNAESAKYLTDLVYFSAEPTADGALKRDRLRNDQLGALQAIKSRHGVALLLTVGGWERSAGFAEMAALETTRARFAVNARQFCLEEHFDGIDLDWEHPADDEQRKNYDRLITAMKREFQTHELQLTVAIAAWQVLSPEAIAAVDRVHLMAYDNEGRHATFDDATSAVQRLLKAGVPAAKICLGVPFYGREVRQGGRSLTYAEIVRKYSPAADTDEVDGFYFNGPGTIARKTRFARAGKLGGIMIWELGQDIADERSLLEVVAGASRQP